MYSYVITVVSVYLETSEQTRLDYLMWMSLICNADIFLFLMISCLFLLQVTWIIANSNKNSPSTSTVLFKERLFYAGFPLLHATLPHTVALCWSCAFYRGFQCNESHKSYTLCIIETITTDLPSRPAETEPTIRPPKTVLLVRFH